MSKLLRIGLTGGMGSGKSLAADFFTQLGVTVLDADALARDYDRCVLKYYPRYRDSNGQLDRARLRHDALQDMVLLDELEQLLHPLIVSAMEEKTRSYQGDMPYVIWMVPLLVEKKVFINKVDRVLLIDCGLETQMERVRSRGGWSDQEILSILEKQASRFERRRWADDVILNEFDEGQLLRAVDEKHRYYVSIAKNPLWMTKNP